MIYGGATSDNLLRWIAKNDWLLALVLGFLAAIGAAFFLFFLSSNVEATLSGICARQDTNGDGVVDVNEAVASIHDHRAGRITFEELKAVMVCFTYPDATAPTPTPTPVPDTPTPVPDTPTPCTGSGDSNDLNAPVQTSNSCLPSTLTTPTGTLTPTPSPTDGITAVPQPTDTVVCTLINYGSLTAPGPRDQAVTMTRNGTWRMSKTGCDSKTGMQAEFYTFELTNKGHVTVDLEATGADASYADTYLVLRSGDRFGDIQQENDDNVEVDTLGHSNARLGLHLNRGTYTIVATVDRALTVESNPYTLTLRIEHFFPAVGHQADHTVAYEVDNLPELRPSGELGQLLFIEVLVDLLLPAVTPTAVPAPVTLTAVPTPVTPTAVPTPVTPPTPDPPSFVPTLVPTTIPPTPCPDDGGTDLDSPHLPPNLPDPCPNRPPVLPPIPTLPPAPTAEPTAVPTTAPEPTAEPTRCPPPDDGGGDLDSPHTRNCAGNNNGGGGDAPPGGSPPGTPTIEVDHWLVDPGLLFPEAITYAVRQWNLATSAAWPRLLFCMIALPDCAARNTDNKKIEIRTGGAGSCPNSVACIQRQGRKNPNLHIGNMVMILEEPAWGNTIDGRFARHYWTASHWQDGLDTTDGGIMAYLNSVVMHEFGHTAGLDDLYIYKDSNDEFIYPVNIYLMGHRTSTSIPWADRRNLHQLYRNRHGGLPHS